LLRFVAPKLLGLACAYREVREGMAAILHESKSVSLRSAMRRSRRRASEARDSVAKIRGTRVSHIIFVIINKLYNYVNYDNHVNLSNYVIINKL
jgi:hypothetical protein